MFKDIDSWRIRPDGQVDLKFDDGEQRSLYSKTFDRISQDRDRVILRGKLKYLLEEAVDSGELPEEAMYNEAFIEAILDKYEDLSNSYKAETLENAFQDTPYEDFENKQEYGRY